MKKNIFLLFLAICSFSAIHAEVDWKLDDNGTLTIWGTEMPHYVLSYAPWHKDKEKIKKVVVENGVINIGILAFSDCSSLTSVEIPNSVTTIETYAFKGCTSLTSITFKRSTPPEFWENVFEGVNKPISIYVPAYSIDAYKKVLGFSNIQAIPPVILTDNEAYTNDSQLDGADVTYSRNFTNVNWQAIYLPFSLKYEDLKDDFELAYINTVRQYDRDKDGVIDETAMEIVKMKSGSTAPNRPYLIRAKTAGEKTISAKNTTIYAAEGGSVDCSTTIAKYTIIGTYSPIPSETMIANNYYGMGGGKLIKSDGSNGLKPFRWYMKVESRDYSKYSVNNAAKAITIKVLDEETTGIANIQHPSPNTQIFDINGRKVNENNLKPGIYVKNGKKFVK